jgi:glycosyltransferase involved in cell wall biosynthesis
MKVLYLTNGFPPHRWAGTETYTAGIAKGIQMKGHTVGVLCPRDWERGSEYWNGYFDGEYNSIPVRWLDLNWKKAPDPNAYLYKNPIIANYLDKYLDEYEPDIVHVTSCETLSASVIESVKRNNLPLVLSLTDFWFLCPRINLLHGDGSNCNGLTTPWECIHCLSFGHISHKLMMSTLPKPIAKFTMNSVSKLPKLSRQNGLRGMYLNVEDRKSYLRKMYASADVRLTASEFVKKTHFDNGFDEPLETHSYGHDLSWLKDYHGKKFSPKLRIGFIGQIVRSKGVHILLEAAREMYTMFGERLSFSIYGNPQIDPDYWEQLQMISEGLDNIEFCGTYNHEESAGIFSRLDAIVVPSLWYDFPLVIYEAFATHTPVIATNLGGMADAVQHQVSGLLFERGNVTDLANQIKRFILEPELVSNMAKNAPRVKGIEEEANELEAIYEDLV